MDFSITASEKLIPDEVREGYRQVLENEVAASSPQKGAALLYKKEPEQLEFTFNATS